jgi:hypothetical protein
MPKKKKEDTKEKVEKEMSKMGLNYKNVAGAILIIIGGVLVVTNLSGVLMAFTGLVLIYFGLKMVGYNIHI